MTQMKRHGLRGSAGTPITVEFAWTFPITHAPAPIRALSSIRRGRSFDPLITVAPVPMNTDLPIDTHPAICTPGEMVVKSPICASWEMLHATSGAHHYSRSHDDRIRHFDARMH
jgi:hypothetical protein